MGVEVRPAANMIDDLTVDRVEEHAVDGEVAPLGIKLGRAENDPFGTAAVDIRQVAPEGGDLHLAGLTRTEHPDDPETDPDGHRAAKQPHHLPGGGVGGNVIIVRYVTQQQVADAATRPEGRVTGRAQRGDDLGREGSFGGGARHG